jgi:RNA polymerase sigma factor (sigma-70 family)
MDLSESSVLEELIERLQRGDESARDALLARAYERLCWLTGALLQSFPDLKAAHDTESVLHDAWGDLRRALDVAHPPTVADFFRLAAHKIRQALLDLAARDRRRDKREGARLGEGRGSSGDRVEAPRAAPAEDSTWDPENLARWTELHERVERLPEAEREVFHLHYYAGLKQVEIASLLGVPPRKVSYLWVGATERLAEGLDLEDWVVP